MNKRPSVSDLQNNIERNGLFVWTDGNRRYNNTNKAASRSAGSFNHNKLKVIKPVLENSVISIKRNKRTDLVNLYNEFKDFYNKIPMNEKIEDYSDLDGGINYEFPKVNTLLNPRLKR